MHPQHTSRKSPAAGQAHAKGGFPSVVKVVDVFMATVCLLNDIFHYLNTHKNQLQDKDKAIIP